jgi:hypothetical protein
VERLAAVVSAAMDDDDGKDDDEEDADDEDAICCCVWVSARVHKSNKRLWVVFFMGNIFALKGQLFRPKFYQIYYYPHNNIVENSTADTIQEVQVHRP